MQQHSYNTEEKMAAFLAESLANNLRKAIADKGRALLVLPGGSSPRLLMSLLARESLDWPLVTITTTDERCVALNDQQSNAGQIIRLFAEEGVQVHPVPLWHDQKPDKTEIGALPWPADVTVIGMGTDGHIASLFPEMSYGENDPEYLINAAAPAPPRERVSLTMKTLCHSERLILLVTGADKQKLCNAVLEGHHHDLPLARLIRCAKQKLEIHTAPKQK